MIKDHWIFSVAFKPKNKPEFRQLVIFKCDEDYFGTVESAFAAWKAEYDEMHRSEWIEDVRLIERHTVISFDPKDV